MTRLTRSRSIGQGQGQELDNYNLKIKHSPIFSFHLFTVVLEMLLLRETFNKIKFPLQFALAMFEFKKYLYSNILVSIWSNILSLPFENLLNSNFVKLNCKCVLK